MTQQVPKRAPAQLERHIQALELRKRGKSYVAIGRELGMSTSCACRLVKRTFAAMKGKRDELIDDVTRLELQRLDAQVEALWPDLTAPGDENAQVRATASNALIRIAETRAKLLALFAPERHQVTDGNGDPIPAATQTVYIIQKDEAKRISEDLDGKV